MPLMDLDVPLGLLAYEHLFSRILGYVLWPENEERRRTYIAEICPRAIAVLEDLSVEK
jgi:hypothetical protein